MKKTEDLMSYLHEISRQIRTQDNRATDQPMFIVQEKKRDYGYDKDYEDGYSWHNEYYDYDEVTSKAAIKLLDGMYGDTEPYVRIGYRDRWEFVTACFTEQGCKNYIKINKHNHKGELRIYAHHSFRNAEFRTIRDYLIKLGDES